MDLVSSWNFYLKGCCTWHASLKHLHEMVQEMEKRHLCADKWQPNVLWQCRECTALCGTNQPTDACWLCFSTNDSSASSCSQTAARERQGEDMVDETVNAKQLG